MNDSVPRWLKTSAAAGWRLLVLAGVVYVATIVLAETRLLVIPAILSLFVGSLATPIVTWLRRRGINRLLSTLIAFAGAAALLVGVVLFISAEIADSLTLHERTVTKYVSSVLDKLHLANRTQAALFALREGLASLDPE